MTGAPRAHGASGQPVIVLAAGHGRRLGGPKAFAEHHGRTFLERILARCREREARVTLVSDPRFRARMEALLARPPPPFPRPGHPLWLPFYLTPAILGGTWPDGLRGVLAAQPPERIQVLALDDEYLD